MSDRDAQSSRKGEDRRHRGDGDKDRAGQRDRARGDREKGRHRDRDHPRRNLENEERSNAAEISNTQTPVVLLRRPAAPPSAASTSLSSKHGESSSQKKEKQEESSNNSEPASTSARAPVILVRQNVHAKSQDSGKSEASSQSKLKPLQVAKLIMEPTVFEHPHAKPVIDRHMKMMPIDSFKFFPGKGKRMGDYFVITAVGKLGTGKSAILSYLAEQLTDFESEDAPTVEAPIFQSRSRKNQLESQIYITTNNTILIEMAPVFSCAATYDLASQPGNLETTSVTWNLKVMRWALSVSHVALILSDNLLDPNICQLMSSAEVVHPMDSALGEGVYPEIIFVYNKVPEEILTDQMEAQHQSILKTIIGRNPRVYPNLFLIPDLQTLENNDCMGTRLNALLSAVTRFAKYNRSSLVQGTTQFPKIPQKYSAHDWYCNATKLWESMDSAGYFAGYVKLFP